MKRILKEIEEFISTLKLLFLKGFFLIFPISITLFILHFSYNLISNWTKPFRKFIPNTLLNIPEIEIILIVLFIIFIGILVKIFILSPIIHFYFEKLISKIPLIRTIYSAAKTLVDFFNVPNLKSSRQKVVLIQFPKKGYFNLAFQLESVENDYAKILPKTGEFSEKKYFKVFMPNSPNPASGYFLLLPEDEIIQTNLTFEEAIKAIVSCGIITPESIKNN